MEILRFQRFEHFREIMGRSEELAGLPPMTEPRQLSESTANRKERLIILGHLRVPLKTGATC